MKRALVELGPDLRARLPHQEAHRFARVAEVRPASADEETAGEALTLAWQNTAKPAPAKNRVESCGQATPRARTRKR
jgi:hypothetical protein